MQETAIQLSGLSGKIAALQLGNPHGLPILSVHGWLDNAASFVPLAARLSQYNWVSVDLPGHGKSQPRPLETNYHLMDYVLDLVSVVDGLGWEKFILVSHSLGAGIASLFSAAFPHKVEKLVLIDGIGPMSARTDEVLEQLRKSADFYQKRRQRGIRAVRGYDSWAQLIDSRIVASPMERSNAELIMRRSAFEQDGKIFVRSDPRLKHPSLLYMSQPQICTVLGGIECPTLLIQAHSGLLRHRKTTGQRIAAIADIVVEEIAGNHHFHMDSPGETALVVSRFLD